MMEKYRDIALVILFALAMIFLFIGFSNAQVNPDDDPLVPCIDEAPSCEYGRVAVCHCFKDEPCKWFCAANKKAFGR